jgi:hypothetical protein
MHELMGRWGDRSQQVSKSGRGALQCARTGGMLNDELLMTIAASSGQRTLFLRFSPFLNS